MTDGRRAYLYEKLWISSMWLAEIKEMRFFVEKLKNDIKKVLN